MFILWEKEVLNHNLLTLPVRTKAASSTALLVKAMLLEMELTSAVEKKQEYIVAMNVAKHFATIQALFIMIFAKMIKQSI
ncbi:predicted protein [Methanosarcina acetivorans C2A]|uniref:Uncharacterized protein n=1 Tax=Methanosarcina acetivorans (strain ATCC 35395 / DSM 2834 / JCM 12185 / C2A) TaxID=188937 RepID=Q8TRX6_METAC|nr:predicted protein [Methanosarcina acetivorans C2A]